MGQFVSGGETYLRNKIHSQEAPVFTEFVLSYIDGLNPSEQPSKSEQLPAADTIVGRFSVSEFGRKGKINDNQVVYSLILDSSVGDFVFNRIDLISDDGQSAVVEYTADQPKSKYDNDKSGNNITRNMVLKFQGAAEVLNVSVPAQSWQIDYTARMNQQDEQARLVYRDQLGRQTFFGGGFLLEYNAATGHSIKAGLGYVEGVRLFQLMDINISHQKLKDIWLDVCLINDGGEVVGHFDVIYDIKGTQKNDYSTDTERHYLFKIATTDINGVVTDFRRTMPTNDDGYVHMLLRADKNLEDLNDKIKARQALDVPSQGQLSDAIEGVDAEHVGLDKVDNFGSTDEYNMPDGNHPSQYFATAKSVKSVFGLLSGGPKLANVLLDKTFEAGSTWSGKKINLNNSEINSLKEETIYCFEGGQNGKGHNLFFLPRGWKSSSAHYNRIALYSDMGTNLEYEGDDDEREFGDVGIKHYQVKIQLVNHKGAVYLNQAYSRTSLYYDKSSNAWSRTHTNTYPSRMNIKIYEIGFK
ncbi:phage tail-collar fiber domain-containing protein [Pseudomonas sp. HK3]